MSKFTGFPVNLAQRIAKKIPIEGVDNYICVDNGYLLIYSN